ncbi:hypothetical protein SAMN02799631_02761 [Methylobacterium sp. 174MFSha1.1]|uniref:hypothetical protein n=1 Tax=Methylobacterium sp. 174MFSha1.1 TaxID=1502749 RepID=UPI0008F03EF7|nr:hypothetical protein [Methylobacterium sp. 174MFSha1.1]SFU86033.1 hypothetical protein SAMN02799631_02761 [Methylobacterium sp. 174MFSha1.1]
MISESTTSIIYDDEEIRVIWAPGKSDVLAITFGDLISPASGHNFFADTPLRKLGISAIGIMSKSDNWYPARNMHAAAAIIGEIVRDYNVRVTYGGSMGGYGAIKFSRLLGASHVIALCPQWSIDAAECDGFDPGWTIHYRPAMSGMGIREPDVSGKIFVFYDLYNKTDAQHCRMININCRNVQFINVPLSDHYVTTIFAGTANLDHLFRSCIRADLTALRRFSRQTRKEHVLWQHRWLRYALRRFPTAGIRFLLEPHHHFSLPGNWTRLIEILTFVVDDAGSETAEHVYRQVCPLIPDPAEQYLVSVYFGGLVGRRAQLRTFHGSTVIYDLSRNRMAHTRYSLRSWEVPVNVELTGSAGMLYAVVNGIRFYMAVAADGAIGFGPHGGSVPTRFDFRKLPGSRGFCMASNNKFLSSETYRDIYCNRDEAKEWEEFFFDI